MGRHHHRHSDCNCCDKPGKKHCHDRHEKLQCCKCFPTPISGPVVLTEAGRYCLTKNLIFSDPAECIEIHGESISLDLGFHILVGVSTPLKVVGSKKVRISSGTVVSTEDYALIVQDSVDVDVMDVDTSVVTLDDGTPGAEAGARALVSFLPYSGALFEGVERSRLEKYTVSNVLDRVFTAKRVTDLRTDQLRARNVSESKAQELVLIEDGQNVKSADTVFQKIQMLTEQPETALMRMRRTFDSEVDNFSAQEALLAVITPDDPESEQVAKVDILAVEDSSSVRVTNGTSNAHQVFTAGPGAVAATTVAFRRSRDIALDGWQSNDNTMMPALGARSAEFNAVLKEDSFFGQITRVSASTNTVFNTACAALNAGIKVKRGGEHRIANSQSNVGQILDVPDAPPVSMASAVNGILLDELDNQVEVDSVVSSQNGGDAMATVSVQATGESETASVRIRNVVSADNDGLDFVGGVWTNYNGSSVLDSLSNNHRLRSRLPLAQLSVSAAGARPDGRKVPVMDVAFKARLDEATRNKPKVALLSASQVVARETTTMRQVFGYQFTGSLRRRQINTVARGNVSFLPDRSASVERSASEPWTVDFIKQNHASLHGGMRNMNAARETRLTSRTSLRVGGPLPAFLSRPPFTGSAGVSSRAPSEFPMEMVMSQPTEQMEINSNTFDSAECGIWLTDAEQVEAQNNSLKNNRIGYDGEGGTNHSVAQNQVLRSEIGAMLSAQQSSLEENTIQQATVGFMDAGLLPNRALGNKLNQTLQSIAGPAGAVYLLQGLRKDTGAFEVLTGQAALASQSNTVSL